MYSRILFVAALFGAANAVQLGARQEAEEEFYEQEKVTLKDSDIGDKAHTDYVREYAAEGKKEDKKHG